MHPFRAATLQDAPKIVHFILEEAREAEGRSPDPGLVRRGVEAALLGKVPNYWVVVDQTSGTLVGSASVYEEWSDWNNAAYWWLQSFYLKPEVRGAGLSQRLLDHIEAEARACGAIELRLYVHAGNRRAAAAYARAGFAACPYEILSRRLSPN